MSYFNASEFTEFTSNGQPYLPPFQTMRPGDYLMSRNGEYRLVFQPDINLVLWKGSQAVWVANADASNSREGYGKNSELQWMPLENCAFMWGGLFVADNMRGRSWASLGTYRPDDGKKQRRDYLILQEDGNLVQNKYTELFMSDPGKLMIPDDPNVIYLAPGQVVMRGQTFKAGGYTYAFQQDSNFVIYDDAAGVAVWNSHTDGSGGDRLVMQGDGNLVIYRGDIAVWHTHTDGHPGAYAALQANGNLVIFDTKLIWARFGFTPTMAPPSKKFDSHGPNLGEGVRDSQEPIKFPDFTTWTWYF